MPIDRGFTTDDTGEKLTPLPCDNGGSGTDTDDQQASEVPFDNSGSCLTATSVQGALEELATLASGKIYVGNGSNCAAEVTPSGDWTMTTAGVATIANDAVTYAKMQNVSTTSRVIGRKGAAPGDPEELTLSEVLDFIGSAAQGDILYRGASAWARLPAGTSGQFLKTQGASANPVWATPTGGSGTAGVVVSYGAMVYSTGTITGHTGALANILWDAALYNDTWDPGDGGNVQRFWLGADFTFVAGDVDVTNNTITETGHGFVTGEGPVRFTNSGGALPTGISTATNYWIIVVDANTFKVATSRANANSNTPVDITAAGSGTHTCDRGAWLVVPKGVTRIRLSARMVEDSATLAGAMRALFSKEGSVGFQGAGQDTANQATTVVNPISGVVPVTEADRFSIQDLGDDAYNITGGTGGQSAWFSVEAVG